jgi:putative endonuclease
VAVTGRSVLGDEGERAAARFLEGRGYRILERNYRTRHGEIDLIAEDGRVLVFVEVKVRFDDRFGGPAAAITRAKQARIARLARQYLAWRRVDDRPCRFDVVLIWGADPKTRRIELLPGAFEAPQPRTSA